MTTTYTSHSPAALAASSRRFVYHQHQHLNSNQRRYHRIHPSVLNSNLTSTTIGTTSISPLSVQHIVNSTAATDTVPSIIDIITSTVPFDSIVVQSLAVATATNSTICRPSSSDCGGSSSGLGGMTKTDIISSDESSLARFIIF
ncbi:unnamed protein product [Thelazia callipaeda]|uniref:Uncharacterized protein n=1 Tax=Thelazia callipaeda TaxID=103827 RepID=A0A0N5D912_THECL|nr:unnamed protein product [Thelazia callipaeda]